MAGPISEPQVSQSLWAAQEGWGLSSWLSWLSFGRDKVMRRSTGCELSQ